MITREKSNYISTTKKRILNYYTYGIWDRGSLESFLDWWDYFKTEEEQFLASTIVNSINFYSDEDINECIKYLFEEILLNIIKDSLTETNSLLRDKQYIELREDALKRIIITPSYPDKPTASGYLICRKALDVLALEDHNTCFLKDLPDVIQGNNLSFEPSAIVMIDDIIGSGEQSMNSWYLTETLEDSLTSSLASMLFGANIPSFYGCICMIESAQVIFNTMKSLGSSNIVHPNLIYCEMFEDKNQFLHPDSIVFEDHSERLEMQKLLTDLCLRHNISLTGHAGRSDLIAFYHDVPDFTLPLIWCRENWTPLLPSGKVRPCSG